LHAALAASFGLHVVCDGRHDKRAIDYARIRDPRSDARLEHHAVRSVAIAPGGLPSHAAAEIMLLPDFIHLFRGSCAASDSFLHSRAAGRYRQGGLRWVELTEYRYGAP
jgi:hypothetical protein